MKAYEIAALGLSPSDRLKVERLVKERDELAGKLATTSRALGSERLERQIAEHYTAKGWPAEAVSAFSKLAAHRVVKGFAEDGTPLREHDIPTSVEDVIRDYEHNHGGRDTMKGFAERGWGPKGAGGGHGPTGFASEPSYSAGELIQRGLAERAGVHARPGLELVSGNAERLLQMGVARGELGPPTKTGQR